MDYTNCNWTSKMPTDQSKYRYQKQRIVHWDQVSSKKKNARRPGIFYHKLLQHYYTFLIPSGLRILEIGCGHGDLLAALKPSFGVGFDFSAEMVRQASQKHSHLHFVQADAHDLPVKETFDVIILSDLVNDIWDVQCVFEKLRNISHPGTRLVLNFYNNLWRIPLSVVKWVGLGAEVLAQSSP
jgi:SAM-dependent methyltransferase